MVVIRRRFIHTKRTACLSPHLRSPIPPSRYPHNHESTSDLTSTPLPQPLTPQNCPRWQVQACPSFLMIIIAWNYRGICRAVTVRALRVLVRSHHPSIIFVSELKIASLPRLSRIFSSIGFQLSHFVPSVGTSGGLALGWKATVNLSIITANSFLINCLISSPHSP